MCLSRGASFSARRLSRSYTGTGVSRAVLINALTLERWLLVQAPTVAIACTAGVQALLLGCLSARQGDGSAIRIPRIELSHAQGQGHRQEHAYQGRRPLGAFHVSAPIRPAKAALSTCAPSVAGALCDFGIAADHQPRQHHL